MRDCHLNQTIPFLEEVLPFTKIAKGSLSRKGGMRPKEVVVNNKQITISPSSLLGCKSMRSSVPLLEGSEHPLYHQLEREEEIFPNPSVGETLHHNLVNLYPFLIQKIQSSGVCSECVGDYHSQLLASLFRPFYQSADCRSISALREKREDQSPAFRIERYAPVSILSAYLYEALITHQNLCIRSDILNKRMKHLSHTDNPVVDGLMGDSDSKQPFYVEGSLSERETHLDVKDQAENHDRWGISAKGEVNLTYLSGAYLQGLEIEVWYLEDVGSCNLACSLCNSLLPYGGVSSVGAAFVPALVSLERRVRFDFLKCFSAEWTEEVRGSLRPLRDSLEPAYFASYLLEFAGRVKAVVVKVLIRSFASWAAEVFWHLLSVFNGLYLFSSLLSFLKESFPAFRLSSYRLRIFGLRVGSGVDAHSQVSDSLLDVDTDGLHEPCEVVKEEEKFERQAYHLFHLLSFGVRKVEGGIFPPAPLGIITFYSFLCLTILDGLRRCEP